LSLHGFWFFRFSKTLTFLPKQNFSCTVSYSTIKTKTMKIKIILVLFLFPIFGFSQKTLSMNEVISQPELSMNDVTGKRSDGVYRYYEKGATKPFTGILFSNHPNGQIDSWQPYIDGIGQGEWINYYNNGNYKEIGNYEQNLVTGPIKKYYRNGKLKSEGTYKDWRIWVGEWKFYDESGNLLRTENFGKKGSIQEVKAYYQRGDISYAWYAQILRDNGFEDEL